jgi:hypothetical protein
MRTVGRLGQKRRLKFGAAGLAFLREFMIRVAGKSEPERYYLFAGMGGRASRRKQKLILQWAIAAGLLVSAIVAGVLYLIAL